MLPKLTTIFHIYPKLFMTNYLHTLTPQIFHQIIPYYPPNSNLKNLCTNGQLKEALLAMTIEGYQVKFDGYDSLLTLCVNSKALREGRRVHAHMITTRYCPPVYLETRIIVLYTKCDVLVDARNVLDRMREPSVVSWTAMISAYSKRGYQLEALNLFAKMLRAGTPPNKFTFASVLTSCTGACGLNHGRQVHSLIVKSNFGEYIFVGSSLLDMYAKAGNIREARGVFESLPERDVVSCTAIIAGYAQLGYDEEALDMFRQLLREGLESNYVTYASVLTALSGLASLDYGKQVHNRVLRSELPSYVVLQNSFIDMYSKCGGVTYSRKVFDGMSERSVITWNAMLVGYGKHGLGQEVIELFQLMREENQVKPDSVTFMAVLSGCSHGGLVDEGLKFFDEMIDGPNADRVRPEVEHYGCVVDLLGRAGRVENALEFIKKMPCEPTTAIWGSLLGACRVHSNVLVGKFVAKRLFEIEPENAGNYVILSNLYALAGRWEDLRVLRELMKEKSVTKEPGRSWVNLDRTVHTFHAGDRSHPRKEEIMRKVVELSVKIKEAGFVHNLSCVLHDVDDEQKEKILLNHSEKLAIAFGVMSTPSGRPITVVKNLRVCADCHDFAKFVSKVCEREISLRDSNRFHRILGGVCSCGDYW
ncbi:hypothetical protein GIB67_040150 [Kingdonia uniflora]|uniref:DYW domain-containing protein n=1 Tax=Kingdonia uniflora TaxID=39325 RepID=A0A7J7MUS0_9MAGN|nr:hypothetical protein GIB67_040150 [Kingdonia uniflora]